jgi:integrase
MKGSIGYAANVNRWYVAWYDETAQKTRKIYKYKGQYLYDRRIAEKLLSVMQGDAENGTFFIEKYTHAECDVIPYLRKWLESVKGTLSPATYKDYRNSIENHLVPFFQSRNIELQEIQYDTLMELLVGINRDGKGKLNVMYCLHACLDYAWRSRRISIVPPFPKRKAYNIVEPVIEWLPSERQEKVIAAIPLEHQPIFWWLKYHLRRPSEAMALHKEDFNNGEFIVSRGFSDKQEVDRTKTGEIHRVPMVSEFGPYIEIEQGKQKKYGIISPYFFIHSNGKKEGKHYTSGNMNALWKAACKKTGENIEMYAGLKHSTASQLINECGYNMHDVQIAGDWARLDSVKKYSKVEVSARLAILEKKSIRANNSCTMLERKSGDQDI